MAGEIYAVPDEVLTEIAEAIRAKTGSTEQLAVEDMASAIAGIAGSEAVEWHQCPEAVRNYLAAVTYDPSDYSTSQIGSYAPGAALKANTKPVGVTKGGKTYCNEQPNVLTPFASGNAAGTLKPLDKLRWINTPYAANVRDLGGWPCDGGTVRYGLLYRGGEPASADREVLVGECGVRHDLDLRGQAEADRTASPLGGDIWFCCPTDYVWYSLTDKATWQEILLYVMEAVIHNEPVYFHCSAGADRTGTVACILEALLGVNQSDIDKDYELTCFSTGTDTDAHARRRNETDWKDLIIQINRHTGSTFRDKAVNFATACGVPISKINAFRAAMSTGTPETLTGGTHTVTNVLTNVNTNNAATMVEDQGAYTATLTAESGYQIKTVTITMGGVDISACSANGVISIATVTGDIVITAAAEVIPNLFDKAACTINKRYSGGTNEVAANGYYISDYMPVNVANDPCVATWMGVINSTTDKIAFYNADKVALGYAYIYASKVSSGSNPATLFAGAADEGYKNNIGYVWTGTGDVAKASYYDQIAYVRINQKVSGSALAATTDIPDHQFLLE